MGKKNSKRPTDNLAIYTQFNIHIMKITIQCVPIKLAKNQRINTSADAEVNTQCPPGQRGAGGQTQHT